MKALKTLAFWFVFWYNFYMENEKKTAAKQAEIVTISRAEYEEPKFQNQWLLEQSGLAKKRQSGSVIEIGPEGTPTEVVEHRLSDE